MLSNLIGFNEEFSQKCPTFENLDKHQFVGLTKKQIWDSTVPEAALKSISMGNYDFVQAAYLFSKIFPLNEEFVELKINQDWIPILLEGLH